MFNPHLSGEGIYGQITYPKLASPKLNGVRGIVQEMQLVARSLKAIPNDHTRNRFEHSYLNDFDGELVVGPFGAPDVFTTSTSGVMTKKGEPEVLWYVFDCYHPTAPFETRIEMLRERYNDNPHEHVRLVPHRMVHSDEEVEQFKNEMIALGYEGLVLRDPRAKYKQGRSTDLEGSFLRIVPWHAGEVIILGVEEGQINQNESKVNELGYLKKSSHKANKVGSGQAGSFQVRDIKTLAEFSMAVPSDALQKHVWANKDEYIGKLAKYLYKDPVKGVIPRFPQYQGLRSPLDM